MKCPHCKSQRVEVTRTKDFRDGKEVRRERACLACFHAWTTLEIHEALLKRTPSATNSTTAPR